MVSKVQVAEQAGYSRHRYDEYARLLANTVVHCDRTWSDVFESALARYTKHVHRGRLIDFDFATSSDKAPMRIGQDYRADLQSSASVPSGDNLTQESRLSFGTSSRLPT